MVNLRLFAPAVILSLLFASTAHAFVVEQTSEGHDLHWGDTNPHFYINQNGTPDVTGSSEFNSISASFNAWASVTDQNLSFQDLGTTTLDYSSVNCGQATCMDNNNIVTWAESGWVGGSSAIGLTYTLFYVETGEIVEADITLNGQNYFWTDSDSNVDTDVKNIVTHEVGHFFGLGHSTVADATMYATAAPGETKKRDLHQDDIDAIRYLYGNGSNNGGGDGSGSKSCCAGAGMVLGPLFLIGFVFGGPRPQRRRRRRIVAGVGAAGLLALLSLPGPVSDAATLEALPLDSLTDYAELIVRGEVLKVDSVRDPQMGIITTVEVKVAESYKGPAPPVVLFVEQGGEPKDDIGIGLRVSGMPQYKVGEEVVVFLEEGAGPYQGFFRTLGLVQGKFRIETDRDGNQFAVRDLAGVPLMRVGADGHLTPVATQDVPTRLPLGELESAIHAVLKH